MTLLKVIVLSRFLGKFKTDSRFALPVILFFFLEILKKSSENDQSLVNWSFSELFYFFFAPDSKSEKQFP